LFGIAEAVIYWVRSGRLEVRVPGLFDGFEGYYLPSGEDIDRALATAMVALDANVMLSLYRYNAQTVTDVLSVLEALGDRLVVPHQSLVEFHRNRLSVISNPGAALKELRDALEKSRSNADGALGRWAQQVAMDEPLLVHLREDLKEALDSIETRAIQVIPDRISPDTPSDQDTVLTRLGTVLKGKVLPKPDESDWSAMVDEGKRRVSAKQPPGYLDAEKADLQAEGAAGDYLVYWQAVLHAADLGKDLLIVTNDQKEDWWWRKGSSVLGPRLEMVEEFRKHSEGRRLYLLRAPDLLKRSKTALSVLVSPDSAQDAERVAFKGENLWSSDGVNELLSRLRHEGLPQAAVIEEAAWLGGIIDRAAVYEICGYDSSRMLRGFTRPTTRITLELQDEGSVPVGVKPILETLYPDDVRTSGFRIPDEVVDILQDEQDLQPLIRYLESRNEPVIQLVFSEIETILGAELRPVARRSNGYWQSRTNAMGRALTSCGYQTRGVNVAEETLNLTRL
jgi:hypothetical protein